MLFLTCTSLPSVVIYAVELIPQSCGLLSNVSSLTLAIGHQTVMHSYRWQILCKRMENEYLIRFLLAKVTVLDLFPYECLILTLCKLPCPTGRSTEAGAQIHRSSLWSPAKAENGLLLLTGRWYWIAHKLPAVLYSDASTCKLKDPSGSNLARILLAIFVFP